MMPLIETLLGVASPILKSIFPDPEDKVKILEAERALQTAMVAHEAEIRKAAAGVIMAEANGESWLQRNWRPIVMLFFSGLVGAYWFGFTAPNLDVSTINSLLDIVQVGLGGYVIGRSAEKVVRSAADAYKSK